MSDIKDLTGEEPENPTVETEDCPECEDAAAAPAEEISDAELAAAYGDKAYEFLSETIRLMGLDAEVRLTGQSDSTVDFEFVGPDIALLIGKHGKTIDALQYLADVTAYKKYPCRKRVVLDADNHRSKRTKELEEKVLKIAAMVREYGKEAVMEPQSAKDRRFIHMLLANEPGVKTYSEGAGAERHIVISPK